MADAPKPVVPMGPPEEAAPPKEKGQLLFDRARSRPGYVTPEMLRQYPNRFEPVGKQNVVMLDAHGNEWNVPASEVQTALNNGGSLLPEDQQRHRASVDFYLEQRDSAADVAAHEFINQFAMGVPGTVEEHTANPDKLEAIEEAKKNHRVAQFLVGAGGVVANVYATGGLGELFEGVGGASRAAEAGIGATNSGINAMRAAGAAEGAARGQAILAEQAPSLVRRLGTQTGKGMLEGLAYSAPQTATQAYYGDYKRAAEDAGVGIGLGGILGLGGGLLSEAIAGGANVAKRPLKNALEGADLLSAEGKWNAERAGQIATEEKLRRLGISQADARELGAARIERLGEFVKGNPEVAEAALGDLQAMRESVGKEIGAHSEYLDGQLASASKQAKNALKIEPSKLAQDISADALEHMPMLKTEMGADEARELGKIVKTVQSFATKDGDSMTFKELQELKTMFSDKKAGILSKAPGMLTPKEQLIRRAYNVLRANQEEAMNSAYNLLDLTPNYAKYLDAKQRYGALDDLIKFGPKQFEQFGLAPAAAMPKTSVGQLANKAATAIGGGVGSAIGGIAGHATGLPLGGFAGAALGRRVIGPMLERRVTDLSLGALKKIADGADSYNWLGAAIAKNVTADGVRKLTAIPGALSTRGATVNADPIRQLLGGDANGLSKQQQLKRVMDTFMHAGQNPDGHTAQIEHLASLFHFDPNLMAEIKRQSGGKIQYAYDTMPKPPMTLAPFQKKEWKPPAAETKAWLQKLEMVINPYGAIDHLSAGSLTKNHLEALRAVYPNIAAGIESKVREAAYDKSQPSPPTGTKIAVGKVFNENIFPTGTNRQGAYQRPQMNGEPSSGKHSRGGGHAKNSDFGLDKVFQTSTQRTQYK